MRGVVRGLNVKRCNAAFISRRVGSSCPGLTAVILGVAGSWIPDGVLAGPGSGVHLTLWPVGILLLGVVIVLGLVIVHQQRRLDLYRDAVDAAPDPRQIVSKNGQPLRANAAFKQYFTNTSLSMSEAIAQRAAGAEAAARVRHLPGEAQATGQACTEVALSEPAGPVWLDVQALPLRRGGTFWVAHDVTRRRLSESMVNAERARFVGLLEHAPVGFFSVDHAGRFVFANATLAHWLGTTREALTDGSIQLHDIVPLAADDPAQPWSPFGCDSEPVAESGTCHGEVTLTGWDSHSLRAYISQEIVTEDGGDRFTTRSVVRNLSEERAFAEALERSERRFRRLFEEAPVGIGFLDAQGVIAECNHAFRDMLAPRAETLAQCRLVDLVAPEDREGVEMALTTPRTERRTPPQVRGHNGDTVCTLFATRFDDGQGESSHVVHLIDSTEQKRLEVQFAQSQKMQAVGQLAGGVAHDFNNLLTAMTGFCDLLLLRHRPGDQSFADLMQIKQNANRAASLVRQLLAFSRQQTLRPTVISVTDVLAELTHLLRRLLGETIELEISHGRDLYPVKVDQGQLEQVIINLAVNARDAVGEEGGSLTIRTATKTLDASMEREGETIPAGDYVLIELADTGHGIPKEHLDRIFEPFFSTKEFGAGTGLGLSTVYGIVKQTGGFILVDSEVGTGTSFRIYLPRYRETSDEAAARSREAAPARDLTGAGTLLLVEDEDAVRSFAARALRKKGYTVIESNSGEQALNVLEDDSQRIDVLVTDVIMPVIDGPTLVRRARKTRPDMKVIFISGYAEDSVRQNLDSEDEVHFLSKPFSLKQLASTVKQALDTRQTA